MGHVKGAEENHTVSRLRERFPEATFSTRSFRNETTLLVRLGDLIRFCRYLKEDPGLLYDFLSDLTAVDRFGDHPRFEVVYHLYSLQYKQRIRLKVHVEEGEAVPSVTTVWGVADWHEREVFDMFGIRFEGHPDLRRILMPEGWEGCPLRKDYPGQASPKWWEEGAAGD
ncbi:MAG: NADH-quinone oxidoreductase subunit C [Candidatus Methylomirabilis oxygeniifera]|uniref:NADH-quinone oxidoreductase subunit C n=1 Tax=Methylomirabilis oxygeniifera TaxID=671143 RepID=D5MKF0_METO1|nr:MAG: NADH-quinone oxidoreductase subunit C [Candidatus Methylomirabilis oxyfera]CBE69772.1 NADH-quinone oxidoreductase [Candidatus Methylomirabilis oxyfera]